MLVLLFITVLALANAEEYSPNCDLVSISHVNIDRDENILNIQFSWDRKEENYAKIGEPIKAYLIRHGPMVDGKISMDADFINLTNPQQDGLTLENVEAVEHYGIQVCAITDQFPLSDGQWDNAWTGTMDFEVATTTTESDTNRYNPRCDLVQTSYVGVDEDASGTLTIHFAWDKKQKSYENFGPIDHYWIRHGPESAWGGEIDEIYARYMDVPNDTNSVILTNVQPGTFYAIQLCAQDDEDNDEVDWKNEAWLGGMDFTNYPKITPDTISDKDDQNTVTQEDNSDMFMNKDQVPVAEMPVVMEPYKTQSYMMPMIGVLVLCFLLATAIGVFLALFKRNRGKKIAPIIVDPKTGAALP